MIAGSMIARMVMISASCGAEMGVATVREAFGQNRGRPRGPRRGIHQGGERRRAFEPFDLHRRGRDGKEMREANQFRYSRRADLSAKGRVKRLAESLDIKIELMLPDGTKQVTQANDHGLPLAETAGKNPLRKEVQKLAKSLHELNKAVEAGKA